MAITRLVFVVISVAVGQISLAFATEGVTIDDLVARTQIPLASIAPDGDFAAYLLVRGDPIQNNYIVDVEVVSLRSTGNPIRLSEYRLLPGEAFDDSEGFRPAAGDLMWTAPGRLLFLARSSGKMSILSWGTETQQPQVLSGQHDRIVLTADSSLQHGITAVQTDFIDRSSEETGAIVDNALRIQDGFTFVGPLRNPKLGRRVRSQKWRVIPGDRTELIPDGPATEGWESTPLAWDKSSIRKTSTDMTTFRLSVLPSPDGTYSAVLETALLDLKKPNSSYSSARIVLEHGSQRSVLVPFARPKPKLTLLGWEPNGQSVYYLKVGDQSSTINDVTVDGRNTTLFQTNSQLEVAGDFYGRGGLALSRDGQRALLVRSTNTTPAELMAIDLTTGELKAVSAPNDSFSSKARPDVRFFPIDLAGQDAYGRLYLPLHYERGKHYPLVFTTYYSQPGFYATTGDEIPILPLTSSGIAVFALQCGQLSQISSARDFRLEIARVEKPLRAMEWVYRKLVADGVVDPNRVGVTGLSYGSEIAMYAYWRSRIFRAVSAGNASWDPALVPAMGVRYSSSLEERGFPMTPDDSAIHQWRELSAGLNARSSLPPLLLQTPDREESIPVPTWLRLRRAGAAVEWYEYPNEGHVKSSPADKWWVYSRNLDWFRFWLNGEEDPAAAKAEQYQRWRDMRSSWEAAKMASKSAKVAQ